MILGIIWEMIMGNGLLYGLGYDFGEWFGE
jgi:hypothetical protein